MEKIKLSTTKSLLIKALIVCSLVGLFYISTSALELDITKFFTRLANAPNTLRKFLVVDFSHIAAILQGMATSIALAVSSLALGLVIALVLSFLAAANIAPNQYLAGAIKGVIAVVRAVPALIWVLMVVASLGFGNTGGVVGLIFPTVGYLTKSFTASIEELGFNSIEAMRTTGANRFTIITKALLPSLAKPFITWIAIRFEGNIAESISLGMVGVSGIGSMLMKALGKYDYASISAIILVIFTTLFTIELLINRFKRSI